MMKLRKKNNLQHLKFGKGKSETKNIYSIINVSNYWLEMIHSV